METMTKAQMSQISQQIGHYRLGARRIRMLWYDAVAVLGIVAFSGWVIGFCTAVVLYHK